jgi:uncharacterized protein with von Willebrand factor type A (vWA) domain
VSSLSTSIFITDEDYIRMGLAKSAFKKNIYSPFILDHFIPMIDSLRDLFSTANPNIKPKLYQFHDALLMFHQPYKQVINSLKKENKAAPAWLRIIQQAVSQKEFPEINRFTAYSAEMSIMAAYQFLSRIFRSIPQKKIEEIDEKLKSKIASESGSQQIQSNIHRLGGGTASCGMGLQDLPADVARSIAHAVGIALREIAEIAKEYRGLREEAESALNTLVGSGGSGYTKEAVSVIRFLEKPDEFRRNVRVLKLAKIFMNRFLDILPTSLAHEQQSSLVGGVAGVGRMIRESQIPDLLPLELAMLNLGNAGKILLTLKIIQRQAMTYQRAAAIKPIVFLDKSGSMAREIERDIPKISLAAGLAIALYKKYGGEIYLFDTETEKVSPAKVIETLLRVKADSGTNIDSVIEEILRIKKQDNIYLIISDGITAASDELLDELSKIARRIRLILINTDAGYNWVEILKKHGNVYNVRSIAEFERASISSLRD